VQVLKFTEFLHNRFHDLDWEPKYLERTEPFRPETDVA
jgi:hypothetical protein